MKTRRFQSSPRSVSFRGRSQRGVVARRSNDGYLVLAGQFAFDEIRDGLHDRVYDDDEFRGYEIWSSGGLTPVATTVALIEDEGLLVMGKEDSVLTILRNLSTEKSGGQGRRHGPCDEEGGRRLACGRCQLVRPGDEGL